MAPHRSFKVAPTSPLDSLRTSLAKNTALYRMALQQPIDSKMRFDQWYRVNISIVTEMGLLLTHRKMEETFPYGIRLTCSIYHHQQQISCDTPLEIEPLIKDIWEADSVTIAPWPGFAPKCCHGGFKYRLPNAMVLSDACYLVIQSTIHSDAIMPLVIGPIQMDPHQAPLSPTTRGWKSAATPIDGLNQNQIYHKYAVNDTSHLLIKEHWNCGTAGKVWDSALLLTALFAHAIYSNPDRFANHRILDLSAGTGYIGLYIAKLYQLHPQPPTVILTDVKKALPLLYENQALNSVNVAIMPLLWGKKKDARQITWPSSKWAFRKASPLDIVIASDVLFNIKDMASLIQTFTHLCTPGKTVLYFGYKHRGLKEEELMEFFYRCQPAFHIDRLEPTTPCPSPPSSSLVLPNQSIPHHAHISLLLKCGASIYVLRKKENAK